MTRSNADSSYGSDEAAPLLSHPRNETPISSFSRPKLNPRTSSVLNPPQAHSPRAITVIILAIFFVLGFGQYLLTVPSIRILEDIICHHYYDDLEGGGRITFEKDIDESMCKGYEVQNRLSVLAAGLQLITAIPALITTIPYGALIDRLGRKPVFHLSLLGLILAAMWQLYVMWFWQSLPLWLVLAGPLFTLIGGGSPVAAMCFYSITCDIHLEANRANVFLFGASSILIGETISPTLATILMKSGPWPPALLGMSILISGGFLSVFIPETIHMRPRNSNPSHLIPSVSHAHLNTTESSDIKKSDSFMTAVWSEFANSLTTIIHSFSILRTAPIILLLLTFVIQPLSSQSVELSLRYMSKRFEFPLRLSSLLLSLRAGVNVILFVIIIPLLSHCLVKKLNFSSSRKDLFLARSSVIVLTVGVFLIAAAPTLPLAVFGMAVFTLGTGYISLTRSLITTLVDREHIGLLYAQIAIMEVVGAMISGPSLAKLYIMGLKMKGAWVGLPFFGAGVVFVLAASAVWIAGYIMTRRGWEDKINVEEREELVRSREGFLRDVEPAIGAVNQV